MLYPKFRRYIQILDVISDGTKFCAIAIALSKFCIKLTLSLKLFVIKIMTGIRNAWKNVANSLRMRSRDIELGIFFRSE